MKAYFDSSVLIPALMESHPRHRSSREWLEKVAARRVRGLISTHGAAETWRVLSVIPGTPALAPDSLAALGRHLLEGPFEVVEFNRKDYVAVLAATSEGGHRGGVVYDALHLRAARKSRADVILTHDRADFVRLAPDLASRIREP